MSFVNMELPTLPAGTTVVPSGIGIGGRQLAGGAMATPPATYRFATNGVQSIWHPTPTPPLSLRPFFEGDSIHQTTT
jgi:hypothetical protein